MARVCPLFSGSSGNSSYIATAGGGLLIDAGVSCKRLFGALCDNHIDPCGVRGVLITHEHTDHISGLRVFLKKTGAMLFASEAVLDYLCQGGHLPAGTPVSPVRPDEPFEVDDVEVRGFAISHDSVGPLGYRLSLPDGRTAAYATDMGVVTESVIKALTGADLVILEANYDPLMLAGGSYPYILKKRIMSDHGHLANLESAKLAAKLVATGTTRIVLAHLSQENNRPDIAHTAVSRALEKQGMVAGIDYTLSVAPRNHPGDMIAY